MSRLNLGVEDTKVEDTKQETNYGGSPYLEFIKINNPIDEALYSCKYKLTEDQDYFYTICQENGDVLINEKQQYEELEPCYNFLCKVNNPYNEVKISKSDVDNIEKLAYKNIPVDFELSTSQLRSRQEREEQLQSLQFTEPSNTPLSSMEFNDDSSPKYTHISNATSHRAPRPSNGIKKKYKNKSISNKKKLMIGGVIRRFATVSDNTGERAMQSRMVPEHVEFFWHIWNHFAPSSYKHPDPRNSVRFSLQNPPNPIYIKMPIYHHSNGMLICYILLRCNIKNGNVIYSVLFEFTNLIHWSIFYSHCQSNMNNYQVSQFHITINAFMSTVKKRIFFEYTDYINNQIKYGERNVIGVVSQLMIRAMYQLVSGRSQSSNAIMDDDFMGLRTAMDDAGCFVNVANTLTNIAKQHIELVETIQYVLTRTLNSDIFGLRNIIIDITSLLSSPAESTRRGGGKNMNKYLNKINNIKEKLKLLKKDKVKNDVKITMLSNSIDDIKAKLKKQKEKDKAKIKKQKEKDKAKLKKQKEKDKAKLKKQKEKGKAKLKKQKEKGKAK